MNHDKSMLQSEYANSEDYLKGFRAGIRQARYHLEGIENGIKANDWNGGIQGFALQQLDRLDVILSRLAPWESKDE